MLFSFPWKPLKTSFEAVLSPITQGGMGPDPMLLT